MARHHVAHGTIEGTFDRLVYPGTAATHDVIEFISNEGFDDDGVPIILGDCLEQFYANLGQRGAITGTIYYRLFRPRRVPVPTLLIAETLTVFPPDDQLPHLTDIAGTRS